MVSIAPIEPIDQPELPKPSTPPRGRSLGQEVLFGLVATVAVAALGAPVGLIWSWIAPKVELVQTQVGPYPIEGEPEGYFADDGWFMIIGAVAGILLAVTAWFVLRRYRGPFILAGLVIGSAAGAALAAWLGNKIGYAHYLDLVEHAPVDTRIFRPAKVRAGEAGLLYGVIPWVKGSLLVQALAAAVIYTCLAGFHTSPTLTWETDPDAEFYPGQPYPHPGHDHLAYGPPPADGHPTYGPPPSWPSRVQPADGQPFHGPPPWPGPVQSADGHPFHGPPAWPAAGQPTGNQAASGQPGDAQSAFGPTGSGEASPGQPTTDHTHGEPSRLDLRKPPPGPAGTG
ncbi:DUF2567 domain-containing protein [Dactylosporangium sp. NPDC005555]|uniref:DUF2567 domain-containing protein n=1 Tax=Dactylosporangium sp. NPDC005555 TaxID=3154889 RepID=UPI0033B1951B